MLLVLMGVSCTTGDEPLYSSDAFTLYPDKVVQGAHEAKALSSEKIISDYQHPVNDHYSRLITFKFSINELDNEMPSGTDHWVIVDNEHTSPLLIFGKEQGPAPAKPGGTVPANHRYTFRVDMRYVLRQFDGQGYYRTFDGERLERSDFEALYIAGGSDPLTWDFSRLEENNLELTDPDGDSIYEITLRLNPTVEADTEPDAWILKENIRAKAGYASDQLLVDALYKMAVEEALLNIESDSTLRTGEKWGGVWTRDVSYSTILAFAFHEPEIAKISLKRKVKDGRIIQDTGSGGSWPVSSDRVIWAVAAWEIYKVTGEREWLEYIYPVIRNSLADDHKTLYDSSTGMFRGESSFLDWREQTYPAWMDNADIFSSQNLSTNAIYYRVHVLLSQMAALLGEPSELHLERAEQAKEGINKHLWMPDQGYYGQYLYGRKHLAVSPRFEGLGTALSVLFGVADQQQSAEIIASAPVTPFGTTCIYPQIPGIPPYHNNGIWPFVQAYWNLAAAQAGNEEAVVRGLAAIYRPAALFLSNYENFVATSGSSVGTEINSRRMLWSIAGNIAMVHRLFTGINYETMGIRFAPFVPEAFGGTRTLSNLKYRDAILNITVRGYGDGIDSFYVDGELWEEPFIPADLKGEHTIGIILNNRFSGHSGVNALPVKFSPPAPEVREEAGHLVWEEINGVETFHILRNGVLIDSTGGGRYTVKDGVPDEYAVIAKGSDGLRSFMSEPVYVQGAGFGSGAEGELIVEVERASASAPDISVRNYTGSGYVEVSVHRNRELTIPVEVKEAGRYFLDVRYSNGTGPWNTDNNCAIRSLYVNGSYRDVVVMPQRGEGAWSDWGYSNIIETELRAGINLIKIVYEPWNRNMDGEINRAMVDHVRLIK